LPAMAAPNPDSKNTHLLEMLLSVINAMIAELEFISLESFQTTCRQGEFRPRDHCLKKARSDSTKYFGAVGLKCVVSILSFEE
jgi:hypothetical protein